MTVTKPLLGLTVGGTLGLLDGLSGFFYPSLAPVMTSVITFSLLKGLLAGIGIGYFSNRVHSLPYGLFAGVVIAAIFSLLVILRAGMGLFWDIMLPGMLLGLIVGFATQKFGKAPGESPARASSFVGPGSCRNEVSRRNAMKTISKTLIAVALVVGLAGSRLAAGSNASAEAFAQLKTLAGHWEEQKASESKSTLDIELTAGGTAVLEKFHMVDQGKPVEMITLYYLDGGEIKLTHYCMAGNQPTMRGSYAPETKMLTFDFESAGNLKSPNDGHMHHAVYKFIDNDHFQTTWTFRKDQKDAFTEDVSYARK